jgi:hypothetical protein
MNDENLPGLIFHFLQCGQFKHLFKAGMSQQHRSRHLSAGWLTKVTICFLALRQKAIIPILSPGEERCATWLSSAEWIFCTVLSPKSQGR